MRLSNAFITNWIITYNFGGCRFDSLVWMYPSAKGLSWVYISNCVRVLCVEGGGGGGGGSTLVWVGGSTRCLKCEM